MKIEIVIPAFSERTIEDRCRHSLESVMACGIDITYRHTEHFNIDPARTMNRMAATSTCDKILFIDSDIEFTPGNIQQLVESDKPVITGKYTKRGMVVAGQWGNWIGNNQLWLSENVFDIVKIEWCGTGFLMVDTDIFRQVSAPWFYYPVIDNIHDYVSYDIGFCMKLTEYRIPLFIDGSCSVTHLTRVKRCQQ